MTFRVRPLVHAAVALVFLGLAGGLRAENLVTVRAVANKDYAALRAETSPPKPESFVVMKGKFYAGQTHDRTLEKKPFIEVARTVASDLRRQGYLTTRDTKTADLLIVIHWGVTDKVSRYSDFVLTESGSMADASQQARDANTAAADIASGQAEGNSYAAMQEAHAAEANYDNLARDLSSNLAATTWGAADNSALLGFNGVELGNTVFGSDKGATLKGMSEEERYFIIVTAYNFKKLRETRKAEILWVARLSTRAAGINFNMAVSRLSDAGGAVFGQSTDGVDFKKVKKREGRIEYGDLEVIETK